jgi:hypothetical protein
MERVDVVAAARGANCRPVHGLESGDGMRWGTYGEERFGRESEYAKAGVLM